MNWRPWIAVALLAGVTIVNTVLVATEEVASPTSGAETKDEVKDRLLGLPFTPSKRLSNFQAFGLPDELAQAAGDEARRIDVRKDRFRQLLRDHADQVAVALCPGGRLPQRYAALSFLVQEVEGNRQVVPYDRVTYFETQPWFTPLVDEVYEIVELSPDPLPHATAMGVAAILLGEEDAVLEGRSPWGQGLTKVWRLDRVITRYPEVERKLVAYFAMMHVLTEIANHPTEGICR